VPFECVAVEHTATQNCNSVCEQCVCGECGECVLSCSVRSAF